MLAAGLFGTVLPATRQGLEGRRQVYEVVTKEELTSVTKCFEVRAPMWRAQLRPDSSSSFARGAHHPGRALHEVGNTILSIVGVRSMDLLFWEERMQAVSDELIACTEDGSYGREAPIIAREYGIPALLGTGVATKRIQFGQNTSSSGLRLTLR